MKNLSFYPVQCALCNSNAVFTDAKMDAACQSWSCAIFVNQFDHFVIKCLGDPCGWGCHSPQKIPRSPGVEAHWDHHSLDHPTPREQAMLQQSFSFPLTSSINHASLVIVSSVVYISSCSFQPPPMQNCEICPCHINEQKVKSVLVWPFKKNSRYLPRYRTRYEPGLDLIWRKKKVDLGHLHYKVLVSWLSFQKSRKNIFKTPINMCIQ